MSRPLGRKKTEQESQSGRNRPAPEGVISGACLVGLESGLSPHPRVITP